MYFIILKSSIFLEFISTFVKKSNWTYDTFLPSLYFFLLCLGKKKDEELKKKMKLKSNRNQLKKKKKQREITGMEIFMLQKYAFLILFMR